MATSIFGYFAPYMTRLDFLTSAHNERMTTKATREVNVMLLILSLYSSILALAIWQEHENELADS